MPTDTMIVAVYDSEENAYSGVKKLEQIHKSGDLAVYSYAVISKEDADKITIKKSATNFGSGMLVGFGIGGLIGLLAGPAGVILGSTSGMLIGSWRDFANAGVDANFVDDVSLDLTPGKFAIVAEIQESWQTPLNVAIKDTGGTLHRKPRIEVMEDQIEREIEATQAEWKELSDELKNAPEEAKAHVQESMDAVKKRADKLREQVETRVNNMREESQAKLDSLREQSEVAKNDMKSRYNARIGQIEDIASKTAEKAKDHLHRLRLS